MPPKNPNTFCVRNAASRRCVLSATPDGTSGECAYNPGTRRCSVAATRARKSIRGRKSKSPQPQTRKSPQTRKRRPRPRPRPQSRQVDAVEYYGYMVTDRVKRHLDTIVVKRLPLLQTRAQKLGEAITSGKQFEMSLMTEILRMANYEAIDSRRPRVNANANAEQRMPLIDSVDAVDLIIANDFFFKAVVLGKAPDKFTPAEKARIKKLQLRVMANKPREKSLSN